MRFVGLACALLSAALVARASPVVTSDPAEDVGKAPPKCNKDWSNEACGACHYFRECVDARTNKWIHPCDRCDHTSWCNCTAPPDILNPPEDLMRRFRF